MHFLGPISAEGNCAWALVCQVLGVGRVLNGAASAHQDVTPAKPVDGRAATSGYHTLVKSVTRRRGCKEELLWVLSISNKQEVPQGQAQRLRLSLLSPSRFPSLELSPRFSREQPEDGNQLRVQCDSLRRPNLSTNEFSPTVLTQLPPVSSGVCPSWRGAHASGVLASTVS